MLHARAHSFAQQTRLAITLAWIAGYTNILTVLTCGTVTSHVSGTLSGLGRDIAEGAAGPAWFAFGLLASFFAGAFVSGACTEGGRRRGWESIYVLPIGLEMALLTVVAVLLEARGRDFFGAEATLRWASMLAAGAMGLQNATITRISDGVVRTTHVTGVVTDLGLELVQALAWLRDRSRDVPPGSARALLRSALRHPSPPRLALLLSICGSFGLGAALGTLAHDHWLRFSMFPPVLFLAWIVWQDVRSPIAEIRPSDLARAGNGPDLPASLAVFHVRRNGGRARSHRMPDLERWRASLPPGTRVAILDFGGEARPGERALAELREVLVRCRLDGTRLILAGLGEGLARRLAVEWGDDLGPGDLCPDLEMAVLHGIMAAGMAEPTEPDTAGPDASESGRVSPP